RVGRDGTLALTLERRAGTTVLGRCRYALPLQVLAPLALGGPAAVVSVLNPTGGLVGGDRLAIDVTLGRAAHGCLTTPSATKVYRTAGAAAEQRVRLRLEAGAILEWVPDPTIPFVVVAGSGLDAFAVAAGRVLEETPGAVGGVGALPRRGAVVRCLAASAPALTALFEALWAVARRELLGLPALALRKA